jgi:hypothetical protein
VQVLPLVHILDSALQLSDRFSTCNVNTTDPRRLLVDGPTVELQSVTSDS